MYGKYNTFDDKIAYVAYFNAGVRVIDIANPYELKELGYWVPPQTIDVVIQTNDVDVDARGYVYATDRTGNGFWVLQYSPP